MTETQNIEAIWTYLTTTPLTGLTVTVGAYVVSHWIWRRAKMTPLLNPVLLSIIFIGIFLRFGHIEYRDYFDGAKFIHFLLGPATVALAIPLYRQVRSVIRLLPALGVALLAGAVTAAVSAVGIARVLGASRETVLSLAPKSATTPIAMGVAERIGGLPSLTAVFVILTGIVGSILGLAVLKWVRVTDDRARGFALGVAAHGVGTARAIQVGETAGAFAGLGMSACGVATALLVPLLMKVL